VQLSPVERYTPPGGLSSGLKGSILFLQKVYFFWGGGMKKKQRNNDGRGARSAPFRVLMSPKRQVEAAHLGPKHKVQIIQGAFSIWVMLSKTSSKRSKTKNYVLWLPITNGNCSRTLKISTVYTEQSRVRKISSTPYFVSGSGNSLSFFKCMYKENHLL
jgi:hypothetical protein